MKEFPDAPPPLRYRREKKRFAWWTLPVIAVCTVLLYAGYRFADAQVRIYSRFREMEQKVATDTFYPGIYVDGILLSGLTREEALAQVDGGRQADASAFGLILKAGSYNWRISSDEVPLSWNAAEIIGRAYAIGRTGTLEERYEQVTALERMPVRFETGLTYDAAAVRALTDRVAERLTVESRNANVTAFNVAERSFVFSDDQYGQKVDADALYARVIEALDSGNYGATLQVEVIPVLPEVTRAQLETRYGLVSSFTTKTTDDRRRNTNIRIAAEALNGTMVEAGGVISFNTVTGQRTTAKGYQEAGAISGGQTVKQIGGGVCQVSTTLFNAMMRAGGSIVTRYPHAWPSDYVPRGEDATVDWPSTDLVMRNDTAAPMFITAWYEDRLVTVQVYGLSMGDGIRLDLHSETVYTDEPDDGEAEYVYNAQLPLGTTELVRKAHTGYKVETYIVCYRDGVEISREHAYTTNYRKIVKQYEYNDGNPPLV